MISLKSGQSLPNLELSNTTSEILNRLSLALPAAAAYTASMFFWAL